MSKMKDLQITLDDARELVEKFGKEHTDVEVKFYESKLSKFMFTVEVKDKNSDFGFSRTMSIVDVNKFGISIIENALNYFYDCIVVYVQN